MPPKGAALAAARAARRRRQAAAPAETQPKQEHKAEFATDERTANTVLPKKSSTAAIAALRRRRQSAGRVLEAAPRTHTARASRSFSLFDKLESSTVQTTEEFRQPRSLNTGLSTASTLHSKSQLNTTLSRVPAATSEQPLILRHGGLADPHGMFEQLCRRLSHAATFVQINAALNQTGGASVVDLRSYYSQRPKLGDYSVQVEAAETSVAFHVFGTDGKLCKEPSLLYDALKTSSSGFLWNMCNPSWLGGSALLKLLRRTFGVPELGVHVAARASSYTLDPRGAGRLMVQGLCVVFRYTQTPERKKKFELAKIPLVMFVDVSASVVLQAITHPDVEVSLGEAGATSFLADVARAMGAVAGQRGDVNGDEGEGWGEHRAGTAHMVGEHYTRACLAAVDQQASEEVLEVRRRQGMSPHAHVAGSGRSLSSKSPKTRQDLVRLEKARQREEEERSRRQKLARWLGEGEVSAMAARYGLPSHLVVHYAVEVVDVFAQNAKQNVGAGGSHSKAGAHFLDHEGFARALGAIGLAQSPLSKHLLASVDTDEKSGASSSPHGKLLTFTEFVTWILTVVCGSDEAKLRLGFRLLDSRGCGVVMRSEAIAVLTSLISTLTEITSSRTVDSSVGAGLGMGKLVPPQLKRAASESSLGEAHSFVDELFAKCSSDGGRSITWADFRTACLPTGCAGSEGDTELRAFVKGLGHGTSPHHHSHGSHSHSAAQPGHSSSTRNRHREHTLVPLAQKIVFGPRWELMMTIMTGIQIAVDQSRSQLQEEATLNQGFSPRFHSRDNGSGMRAGLGMPKLRKQESVGTRSEIALLQRGSCPTTSHITTTTATDGHIQIKTYAPRVFRQIRTLFGINDDDFLLSLGVRQVLGSLLLGDLSGLSDKMSEAKSSSVFYYSSDQRYILKTVPKNEASQLETMLNEYYQYILANPHTKLCRFLGLYDLTRTGEPPMSFVIMENVFRSMAVNPAEVERYDLKGGQGERSVGNAAYIRASMNSNSTGGNGASTSTSTSKSALLYEDFDFLQRQEQMYLPSANDADALHHQLITDTAFLHKTGVVDYSLLVGVHQEDDHLTYKVAIIDTLTKFGSSLVLQKQCKKYAADFMRLITSIVQ